jgi:hypothetical protein
MSGRLYRSVRATGAVAAGPLLQTPNRRQPHAVTSLRKVLGDTLLQRLLEALARSLWDDYRNASVRLDRVSLRGATPVAVSVDPDRLWRARELLWEYRLANVEPYAPVLIWSRSADSWRLLLPPILESHRHGQNGPKAMYVMDGMHRLHNLHQLAVEQATALVISSPHLPPPPARTPDSWEGVWQAEAGTVQREARFCWLSESLLRPVSQKIDHKVWELSTAGGNQVFPTEFASVEDCVRRAKEILSVADTRASKRGNASPGRR